jgi:GrpB-like predicted nucleotidyltransferase (UPF0157 family)
MSQIGLQEGTVKLASYSTAWRRKFQAEQRRLANRLAPRRYKMEHIGSTAVPGIDAKPIIDIAMQIPSFRCLKTWIALLESAGYQYKGEYGLPGRHFFTRGTPVLQHLHLVSPETHHWNDWLLFRDFLRSHPSAAEHYRLTKQALARRFSKDRDAYTRAKTPLVRKLMRAARQWRPIP